MQNLKCEMLKIRPCFYKGLCSLLGNIFSMHGCSKATQPSPSPCSNTALAPYHSPKYLSGLLLTALCTTTALRDYPCPFLSLSFCRALIAI